MTNQQSDLLQNDSAGWRFFVKISFVAALAATFWGVFFLPTDPWVKGYMSMGILYSVGSSFMLAKSIRDEHESNKILHQIQDAKTQRILREYQPES